MICAICGKSLSNVLRAWDDALLCEACAEPSVPVSAVEGMTVAGARAFWRWRDEAVAHERLRADVMTIYSDPHLTWEQARVKLAHALAAPPPMCEPHAEAVEAAAAALAAPPAAPPADLVALVREYQQAYVDCLHHQLRRNPESEAAYERLKKADAAIVAYPLPAAPPVPETPQGWQPIETAPKDRDILVFSHGVHYCVSWFDDGLMRGWSDGTLLLVPQPTVWQPLPAAPAVPPQEGR